MAGLMMRVVASGFAKMAVDRRVKIATEPVDPVARFSRSAIVLLIIVAGASAGCNVEFGFMEPLVEDGRVIAAMKIGVCFYIEMLGKEPTAIRQSYRKEVGRMRAAAGPRLEPRLEPCRQAHCQHEQHRGN